MEPTTFDMLKLMLESQGAQLTEIRSRLSTIDIKLQDIEVKQTKTSGILDTVGRILSSWQFWCILMALFVSEDFTHFKMMFMKLAGA